VILERSAEREGFVFRCPEKKDCVKLYAPSGQRRTAFDWSAVRISLRLDAPSGNRTRVSTLARSCSTIEPWARLFLFDAFDF
jgi:hypothetical protein